MGVMMSETNATTERFARMSRDQMRHEVIRQACAVEHYRQPFAWLIDVLLGLLCVFCLVVMTVAVLRSV